MYTSGIQNGMHAIETKNVHQGSRGRIQLLWARSGTWEVV